MKRIISILWKAWRSYKVLKPIVWPLFSAAQRKTYSNGAVFSGPEKMAWVLQAVLNDVFVLDAIGIKQGYKRDLIRLGVQLVYIVWKMLGNKK